MWRKAWEMLHSPELDVEETCLVLAEEDSDAFATEDDEELEEERAEEMEVSQEAVGHRHEPFPLLDLPVELVFAVFGFLSVRDLNVIRAAGCRLLTTIADDPSLWRAFYDRHRRYAAHSAVTSMVHVGEAMARARTKWRTTARRATRRKATMADAGAAASPASIGQTCGASGGASWRSRS